MRRCTGSCSIARDNATHTRVGTRRKLGIGFRRSGHRRIVPGNLKSADARQFVHSPASVRARAARAVAHMLKHAALADTMSEIVRQYLRKELRG